MNKKIILFMPSIEGGGVEKNLYILSNFLSKKFEMGIVTADNISKKKFNKKIEFISPKTNFFHKKKKYFKYLICLYLLFKQYRKNKNIAVFSFQANVYAIILSNILRIKIISRSNTSPSGWSNNFIKRWIFKTILKNANLIIVNSVEFKKEMKRKFNLNCKLIYNPLNKKEILKKSNEKINSKFYNGSKYLKIINVARFTDQKDHITLLKAFKIINDKINSKLLILGQGVNESKINNFIKLNNLSNNVKVLRFQNNPYKFIKKSDVFILTSRYEGLPNVLLESIALKKLVISSNCKTGPKEILNNGKYGILFKVGDYKELSSKVIEYSKNKRKYKKMIIKSYNNLHRYDFNKNCNEYYKCVKKYFS